MLLWASMHVTNLEFTHETPNHKIIRIFASNMWGKDKITGRNMIGIYEDWYATAASGNIDLHTYNVQAGDVTIRHHNIQFMCQKGTYSHKNKTIYCENFKLRCL